MESFRGSWDGLLGRDFLIGFGKAIFVIPILSSVSL